MSSQTTREAGVPEWDLTDRLRKSLRAAGVTVQGMADELGYTRKTVGDYLGGRTEPKVPVIRVWAMRCGVPFEWLMHGTVETDPNTGPGQGIRPYRWRDEPAGQVVPIRELAHAC